MPRSYNTVALIFQMSVLQYLFFPFVFFCGAFNKMNESTDTNDNHPT